MALVEDPTTTTKIKENYIEFETLSLISTYIPVMRFCLVPHLSRTNLVDIIHTVQYNPYSFYNPPYSWFFFGFV